MVPVKPYRKMNVRKEPTAPDAKPCGTDGAANLLLRWAKSFITHSSRARYSVARRDTRARLPEVLV
jgi:hypothetical protein